MTGVGDSRRLGRCEPMAMIAASGLEQLGRVCSPFWEIAALLGWSLAEPGASKEIFRFPSAIQSMSKTVG